MFLIPIPIDLYSYGYVLNNYEAYHSLISNLTYKDYIHIYETAFNTYHEYKNRNMSNVEIHLAEINEVFNSQF